VHHYNFFNPKAGVFYEFDTRNRAYLSFAVANREPNRSALVDANPLRPVPVHETLYDFETGYSFSSNLVAFDVTGYYMLYDNQLVLTGKINDVGDPVLENVKESYRAGVEISLGIKVTPELEWAANLALSRNKIMNFTEYVDNWDEWPDQVGNYIGTADIAFSPEVVANSVLAYEPVDGLRFTLFSKYVSSQYISNASAEKLDAYFVNDLLLAYSISPSFMKEITFSLKVHNLLDEEYETNAWIYKAYSQSETIVYDGYFPQAGINFMAGLSLKL
jgi:iron complex outermembrane receptor protein